MGTIEDKSGMQKGSGRRTLVGSPTKCEEMKGWGGVVVGWGGGSSIFVCAILKE